MEGYTEFMWREACRAGMSVEEAVETLRREARIRCVREVLAAACGMPDGSDGELKSFLVEHLAETAPGEKRDSIERKVNGWINEDKRFISKKSAIQLCFALKLPYEEAEELHYRLCGAGFRWREPEEIVFLYAMQQGWPYERAEALYQELKAEGLLEIKKIKKKEQSEVLTEDARKQVITLRSDAELEDFLRENRTLLGMFHNTAYALMMDYFELLRQPDEDDRLRMLDGSDRRAYRERVRNQEEKDVLLNDAYCDREMETEPYKKDLHFASAEKLSMRKVLSDYLHDKLVGRDNQKERDDQEEKKQLSLTYNLIKAEVRENWPQETVLSKIVNRQLDVPRKMLILLFLATDGDCSEYRDRYELVNLTPEKAFEDRMWRLNAMLMDCGFNPLDPRAPFDWMVIYCLCAQDILGIDERVRAFLRQLFADSTKERK